MLDRLKLSKDTGYCKGYITGVSRLKHSITEELVRTWTDAVDPDVISHVIGGDRLGKPDHCRLCRSVHTSVGCS